MPGAVAQPISPGGSTVKAISDACPTFSWGGAVGAEGYELALYEAPADAIDFRDFGEPVLAARIDAPGLSWTPAGNQCLALGAQYQWFVRAILVDGPGEWSDGLRFEVDPYVSAAFEEAVQREVSRLLSQPETWQAMVRSAIRQEGVTVRMPSAAGTQTSIHGQTQAGSATAGGKLEANTLTQAATFNNPSDFRVSGSNGVVFDDPNGATVGTIPAEGAGVRLMWYPRKGAFRAGSVGGDMWDDPKVGFFSTATGGDTTANATFSTAMGVGTTASGDTSTAMGSFTVASGPQSTAMGYLTAATGFLSVAMGDSSEAIGNASTAAGAATVAESMLEFVIGRYDTGYVPATNGATQWNDTDRLFVIGNGTAPQPASRHDALVMLKNGKTGFGESSPLSIVHIQGAEEQLKAAALNSDDLLLEDGDAVLGLYSDNGGNYGSTVSLGEVTAVGNLVNKWSMTRQTSNSAEEPNFLYFTFGTNANYGSNAWKVKFSPTGAAYKADNLASWSTISDVAVKEDIRPIDGALSKLMQIHPVTFRFKDGFREAHPGVGEQRHYSVIAQEFAEVFPDAVTESGEILEAEGRELKQVNIHPALITAIAAIQELNGKLEAENAGLKAEISELRDQLRGYGQLSEQVAALQEQLALVAPQVAASND